jgi:hypothetical protein
LDAEQKRAELIRQLADASGDNNALKVKLTEAENKINSSRIFSKVAAMTRRAAGSAMQSSSVSG